MCQSGILRRSENYHTLFFRYFTMVAVLITATLDPFKASVRAKSFDIGP